MPRTRNAPPQYATSAPSTCAGAWASLAWAVGLVLVGGCDRDAGLAQSRRWRSAPTPPARLAAPVLEGERSAGHPDVLWSWSAPQHTARIEYRLDGGPLQGGPADMRSLVAELSPGPHRLEVRACTLEGVCSPFGQLTTRVESFGDQLPAVFRGVARAQLATSPLGNVAAVVCHNCYNGPANEPLPLRAAQQKIERALERGADLIELDVADIQGTLYVTHEDLDVASERPRLADLLASPRLAASDALLSVEVKEQGLPPDIFARRLLTLLEAHRQAYVHNGRPLLLRAFRQGLPYLRALRDLAQAYHPWLAPYLRFSVLFEERRTMADWARVIEREVVQEGFWGAEIALWTAGGFAVLDLLRSRGLAAGVWTVPGPLGDVTVAGLREDVDLITTDYRVDLARDAVERDTVLRYVRPGAPHDGGHLTAATRPGSRPPPATAHLETDARRRADLDRAAPASAEPLLAGAGDLSEYAPPPSARQVQGGLLVTAAVRFDELALKDGEVQTVLAGPSYALELAGTPAGPVLRFAVNADPAMTLEYAVSGGRPRSCGDHGFAEPLRVGQPYFITGAYGGQGQAHLLIDQRCAGATPAAGRGPLAVADRSWASRVTSASVERERDARPLRGFVQQLSVQRWPAGDTWPVND